MSVAKKNTLLFPIRQAGSCETVSAASRSFVSKLLLVEVHSLEPNLQILQVCRRRVQVISALLAVRVWAICYRDDVQSATCRPRMLLSCAAWCASELAKHFSACDSRVALKDALQRRESFSNWDLSW